MEYEQSTTASGIRVVTETMPSVRSVALGIWIAVGSRDESDEQHGCSHFLEHLLFKGTSRRTARQIAEALDAVGGDMNAFTSREMTCFYARILDRDLPLAADVLADMIVDATNTERDVDSERQVVLSEIDIHLDSPDELVHADLARTVLGDHPLSRETLGTVESITTMSRDTVHGYYLDRYRPGNLVVAASGSVSHGDVVALADEHLGDLGRPGGGRPARTTPDALAEPRVQVRHRPTEQAHVALGGASLAHDHPEREAVKVLNVVLGGGMSSRLFQEIREERGLAYTTYSYSGSYTDTGLYGTYAGTSPAHADEVLKILRDQLDRIADDITNEEVDRAKGNLMGSMVLGLEDPGSRMTRIGRLASLGAPLRTVDEALARIDAVDLDAVRSVARALFGAPRGLAVVGPFDDGAVEHFRAALA